LIKKKKQVQNGNYDYEIIIMLIGYNIYEVNKNRKSYNNIVCLI